jgi:hypothetical protein
MMSNYLHDLERFLSTVNEREISQDGLWWYKVLDFTIIIDLCIDKHVCIRSRDDPDVWRIDFYLPDGHSKVLPSNRIIVKHGYMLEWSKQSSGGE